MCDQRAGSRSGGKEQYCSVQYSCCSTHPRCVSTHLNGEIDDMKSYCAETISYEIHFEDERIDSCMIKIENILILIKMPEM